MISHGKETNKYFSVLGDSISTFEGCSEPKEAAYYDVARKCASGILTPSHTWWGQVIQRLGGSLLVNNSFSGSTVCLHPLYQVPSYACSDERTSSLDRDGVEPDVIMVYMGTNDWGCGFRIVRDPRLDCSEESLTLFMPAYRSMLAKLRQRYAHAEIWCLTPAVSKCVAKPTFTFPYCYGGMHLSRYCQAIGACAEEYGCRLIDLYHSAEPYDTLDGFHPTAEGMKTIADAVLRILTEDSSDVIAAQGRNGKESAT